MQRRVVRQTLLALLVVTGLTAAYFIWDIHHQLRTGTATARDVDARLDRLRAASAALGAAQQAYVAPGQQRGDALTRASTLVQQVYDEIAALRRVVRSSDAPASLLAFGAAMDTLVNVDDRSRDYLRLDQTLMAADLVYTEARQAIDAMTAHLDAVASAERRFADAEERALFGRGASVLGIAAMIWLVGALVLVRLPTLDIASVTTAGDDQLASPPEVGPTIDLGAAAKVCTELSRLSSSAALPAMLARTARVLDASGLIVWLGAGEELFPAMGHGYGPLTLARFGPIPRAADNATATAWRTGELSIVPGGPDTNGAIVAPLFGQSGCFGVLAAEVRHGRERDETARAVARMIAAQLATVVAPWPAASDVEEPASREAGELPASPGASERTAASA